MIAHDHDARRFAQVRFERGEGIGRQHCIPMLQIAEQERHIHQRDAFGENRHVRRREDRVIHRNPLIQVSYIVRLDPQLAVKAQVERHLAIVFLCHQTLEFTQGLSEGMLFVEHACAAQCDVCLRHRNTC